MLAQHFVCCKVAEWKAVRTMMVVSMAAMLADPGLQAACAIYRLATEARVQPLRTVQELWQCSEEASSQF